MSVKWCSTMAPQMSSRKYTKRSAFCADESLNGLGRQSAMGQPGVESGKRACSRSAAEAEASPETRPAPSSESMALLMNFGDAYAWRAIVAPIAPLDGDLPVGPQRIVFPRKAEGFGGSEFRLPPYDVRQGHSPGFASHRDFIGLLSRGDQAHHFRFSVDTYACFCQFRRRILRKEC